MDQEQQSKKLSQIIAKCWSNDDFEKKLLAHPEAVLKAEGVELPEGMSIKVLANTSKVFHLVIPTKPTDLSSDWMDRLLLM